MRRVSETLELLFKLQTNQNSESISFLLVFSWRSVVETLSSSVVEEPQVGVNQGDALLVAGVDHNLVGSRTGRSRHELDAALRTQDAARSQETTATALQKL